MHVILSLTLVLPWAHLCKCPPSPPGFKVLEVKDVHRDWPGAQQWLPRKMVSKGILPFLEMHNCLFWQKQRLFPLLPFAMNFSLGEDLLNEPSLHGYDGEYKSERGGQKKASSTRSNPQGYVQTLPPEVREVEVFVPSHLQPRLSTCPTPSPAQQGSPEAFFELRSSWPIRNLFTSLCYPHIQIIKTNKTYSIRIKISQL